MPSDYLSSPPEDSPALTESADTPREWFRFYTPSECRQYQPPPGYVLVGDSQLVRGNVTVLAGAPGVGKSRAAHALAIAGATGSNWFGSPVHSCFKTAIIQNENGRCRLAKEFAKINAEQLDDYIRISEPPPYGMAFDHPDFRAALTDFLAEFKPGVVVLDPWNSAARDDKHRDYRDALDAIKSTLPKGENEPALVIVAHTKKPQGDARRTGRGLLNEVAGSYVLVSVPRCVFIMQSASDNPEDDRVVWTCSKNNDGEIGPRSGWHRRNGLFLPCSELNWENFDSPGIKREDSCTVTVEAVVEAIGDRQVKYTLFANELAARFKVSERTAKTAIGKAADCGAITKNQSGLYEVVKQ